MSENKSEKPVDCLPVRMLKKGMKVKQLIELLQKEQADAEVSVKGFVDAQSTVGKNLAKNQGLKKWRVVKSPGFRREPDFYGDVYMLQSGPDRVILNAGENV